MKEVPQAKSRLVVRTHEPWRVRVVIGAVVVLLLGTAWMMFNYGHKHAGFDSAAYSREQSEWESEQQRLENQISELRAKVARLEIAGQVSKHAALLIRDELAQQQLDSQSMREELAFYRGIVSPEQGRNGLYIHTVQLVPGKQEREYLYSLTVIHKQGLKKRHRRITGTLDFKLEGKQAGKQVTLPLSALQPGRKLPITLSFKYFNRVKGRLVLPEGFEPETVVVTIKPKRKKINGDTKRQPWRIRSLTKQG
ncbi:MAG TPA: hypothetical protein ENI64_11180 [Gammaproteobacteria bacterium]|nr:hypothetical protein [Gammaproteobacteria bacterium]